MGFTTQLTELTSFIYKAPFDNGLTEHELDHIMLGRYNDNPTINPDEVANWKWMPIEEVKLDVSAHPERYTVWFVIIFERFYKDLFTICQ
jgi:isopentenyl-diphosphate delta-isomerase